MKFIIVNKYPQMQITFISRVRFSAPVGSYGHWAIDSKADIEYMKVRSGQTILR